MHSCRIAGDDGIRGDVLRDDAAGADDGVFTDGDFGKDRRAGADGGPFLDQGGLYGPIRLGLKPAVRGGGPRVGVVDEGHAVPDEDVVFDGHALADEGVAGDLAVFADGGVFLDLHKGADLGVVADRAAVEVDELRELHVFSELDIFGYAEIVIHR